MLMAGFTTIVKAQERPAPFQEADKAMAAIERDRRQKNDSLLKSDNIWSINFTYGQRYISAESRSDLPDTITSVDFTDRKAYFGLGAGYKISNRLSTSFGMAATFLPRNQVITFGINGTGSGEGNGGFILDVKGGLKYALASWGPTRLHVGLELGVTNLIAKGGEITFSFGSGTTSEISTRRARLSSVQVLSGVSHRFSPGFMADLNLGYTHTSETESIGGIVSAAGFTTALTLHFLINPWERNDH